MNKSCGKHNNKTKETDYNYINLRDAIFQCGLSNTKLATRIGVDKSRISDWCNGKGFPKEKNLQRLLDVLNEIQKEKGLKPYSIQYLRGDHNCVTIENEEIYNRIKLKDNAIDTLINIAEKDIQPNSLIPIDKYNHFTYTGTANYVISQNELWETFYNEIKKVLLEIKQNYTQFATYQDVVNSLDTYNASELNATINKIFNDYIRETLKYYFPNE